MKFCVLGCSGGQVRGLKLSSFLIDDRLLIDAGSATEALEFSAQSKITDILITHIHLDHVLSLATLADNLYGKCPRSINVWSTPPIIDGLAQHFFNDQIWPDFTRLKGPTQRVPVLRLRRLPNRKKTRVGKYAITPIGVSHIVPSVAFLITDGRRSLLHIGDTGPTTDVWALANQTDNLGAIVVEASFPNRLHTVATASEHLTPATLAKEIAKLDNADIPIFITHLKPQFRREIIREIKALKQGRLRVLEDGEILRF